MNEWRRESEKKESKGKKRKKKRGLCKNKKLDGLLEKEIKENRVVRWKRKGMRVRNEWLSKKKENRLMCVVKKKKIL